MTKRKNTNGTAAPVTEVDTAAESKAAADQPDLPLPEVAHMPMAVARLSWLQRLILADDLLCHPRRFLAQATHSPADAADPQVQPKADHKAIPYPELRQTLDALLPDHNSARLAGNRRVQRLFLRHRLNQIAGDAFQRLGDLPGDELEEATARLINHLLPFASGDQAGVDSWGQEKWQAEKKRHEEHVAEVVAEIDAEISNKFIEGQRDERVVVTNDLPRDRVISLHSEDSLFWDLVQPIRLAAIHYDDLPAKSPLRQLDPERLPRLDRAGGPPVVLLGPSTPGTVTALPRSWYCLATSEAYCRRGWKVWSQRHHNYLDSNRETKEQFERFEAFNKLCKQPLPTLWPYPDAPQVPALDGFAPRSLFAIDAVGHLGRYVTRPSANRNLTDLLNARRVLVDAVADEAQHPAQYAAKAWVGRWFTSINRDVLAEALWALAKTTLQSIEDLELAYRDHALDAFQREHILKEKK